MSDENFLKELFIDEAKPALERHSGGGGGDIEPITITANGVYDAANMGGGFKTIIDASVLYEMGALIGEEESPLPLYTLGADGEHIGWFLQYVPSDSIVMLFDENQTVAYFGDPEFAGNAGLPGIGWYDLSTAEPFTPPKAMIDDAPYSVMVETYGARFAELLGELLNKSNAVGYNPITVNVPLPAGVGDVTDTTITVADQIPYNHVITAANGEKITGSMRIESGTMEVVMNEISGWGTHQISNYVNEYTPYDLERVDVENEPLSGLLRFYNTMFRENCYYAFAYKGSYATPRAWICAVDDLDLKSCRQAAYLFQSQSSLEYVNLKNTFNINMTAGMFYSCGSLKTVEGLDMRSVTGNAASSMFYYCKGLSRCEMKNIRTSIQIGSGVEYGHLLELDCLISLIGELCDTGASCTFTIGSENLEKLANTYVKLVEITDEMRATDDLIDEKLPFEVCESTDEGATLITDYVNFKNWRIQ